ncbi:hypothetical protein BGP78_03225 [Pseudoalteromonas sp. MSK9-3]|nr:hypothetical protein BGP78_03225 [Pseudoalteromonas sp. MSK9-3]
MLILLLIPHFKTLSSDKLYIITVDAKDDPGNEVNKERLNLLSNINGFIITPTGNANSASGFATYNFSTSNYYDYLPFIQEAVKTISVIRDSNHSGKKIWIALPKTETGIESSRYYRIPQSTDIRSYLIDLEKAVSQKFGNTFWNNNIKGFYMADESLSVSGSQHDYIIRARQVIDEKYNSSNSYNKELTWSPYYGLEANNKKIISYWINNKFIFDKIYIQPNVMFYSSRNLGKEESYIPLSKIEDWVDGQNVSGITPTKNGLSGFPTKIGVNIELINAYRKEYTTTEQRIRNIKIFNETIRHFERFIANQRVPAIFFAESPKTIRQTPSVANCISNIFDNSIENTVTYSPNSKTIKNIPEGYPDCMYNDISDLL